ncbi:L,D-transpeptidase [Patescibacteria group bacterium]|nr:L,D-transpeptidase [Patescibacteria group bacterium]
MRWVKCIASLLGLFSFGLVVLVLFIFLLLLLRQLFPVEPIPLFREQPGSAMVEPPYLKSEEAVIAESPTETASSTTEAAVTLLPIKDVLFEYVEVVHGCGPHFEGECLNARSGPGVEFPSVAKLRSGIVLKVDGKVEAASSTWYKIVFDEWLRYPERMAKNFYVAAEYVEILRDEGNRTHDGISTSTKRIIVDRSEQKLYAYDGDTVFMDTSISTGLELTPTPRGTFTIFKKTPSRYMQGPLPYLAVSKYYDLPGVPWNLYFTEQGAVIHGAYWHDSFGKRYSSGCVNMRPYEARTLYTWAELGTTVTVRD